MGFRARELIRDDTGPGGLGRPAVELTRQRTGVWVEAKKKAALPRERRFSFVASARILGVRSREAFLDFFEQLAKRDGVALEFVGAFALFPFKRRDVNSLRVHGVFERLRLPFRRRSRRFCRAVRGFFRRIFRRAGGSGHVEIFFLQGPLPQSARSADPGP